MFANVADQYANDVLAGRILACKWVKLACQRYLDFKDRHRFSPDHVERVCRWIETLPHTKGIWGQRGQRLKLEPFQIFHLAHVFGFLREDGTRLTRNSIALIPRKNGKTLLSAGVALYMMVADGEYGSEIYCGASSEAQAWEVFKPSKLIVERTPALAQRYGLQVNAKSLTTRDGSVFRPVIGRPADGAMPSAAILDEAHEHQTPDLRDTMLTGMGSRRQPLLWTISTAGTDISCPFYSDVQHGRKILEGTVTDDERFYVEYTVDEGDDWQSEAALRKANPNYNVSIFSEYLQARQREAATSANMLNRFLTKHLNIWCQSKSAYHNMTNWHACRDPAFDLAQYHGKPAILALDTASKQDICALQLLIPLDDGRFATAGRYYLPEDAIHAAGKQHYLSWANAGWIVESDGNMNDFELIEQDIYDLRKRFNIATVVYDDSHAAMLEQRLIQNGVPLLGFTMTASAITEPMRMIDALINSRKLVHGDEPNAPMSWMMSNVVNKTRVRDDRDFPSKENVDSKIDGAVALYMAMAAYLRNPPRKATIYEERGLINLSEYLDA